MTWPNNQPLLLSPWGQSAAASAAAASHSSAFSTTMRGWGGTAQTSTDTNHHTSRPGVSYMSQRETAEQKYVNIKHCVPLIVC